VQPLLNIHNKGKKVYLFERFDEKLVITEDDAYLPNYYEPDPKGKYDAYDGTKLRRIEVNHPSDIKKHRSTYSHSSDINHKQNYLIHQVDNIDKCKIKYLFIDIEVYAKEIPNIATATQPVSCVSIYNSFTKEVKTWWLLDYSGNIVKQEQRLYDDVMTYIVKEQPDIISGWNVDFDYTYLYNRYKVLFNTTRDFGAEISPISQFRSGHRDNNTNYPAGISIMDYLLMFKKVFMREGSYTLDAISQKYLGETTWGTSDFGQLTPDIKDKNANDVVRLQKLEDKFKIFEYFDEIRRLSKTEWEHLYHNSFIIENLLFQEARKRNIILPNRPNRSDTDTDATFQGAAREAVRTGALFDIGKFDLTSAYPNMVANFCLDTTNIVDDDSGINIDGTVFQQDPDTLIPAMIRNILQLKDNLKNEIKLLQPKTEEYQNAKIKYDAIKGVVNSGFGVIGFSSFRLYDNRIASAITFLVRDLLAHSREAVHRLGHEVIYWDTDSVFIDTNQDISSTLNQEIQNWAKLKGKSSIDLSYEYEGYFSKLFIVALCRYIGTLETSRGPVIEMKGIEAKRSNSTKYEGKFQLELIERILNKEPLETVLRWVDSEKKALKLKAIEEIAFPCKVSTKKYKAVPIFVRAYNNTNSQKQLVVPVGEVLWWAYVESTMQDKDGKDMNVFAFTRDDKSVISKYRLDWDEMIRRNIQQKAMTIFESQGWTTMGLTDSGQSQLF